MGVWIGGLSLLLLLVLGTPVGLAMLIAGLVGITLTFGPEVALSFFGSSLYREAASFVLVAIPMFVLMGSLGSSGTIWERLFDFVYRIIGRFRGGMAMAIVSAGAVFGAVSGSTTADAAALGKVVIAEAERYGYARRFTLACVAASATAAVMVPPSITLIVYALLTQTSVARLFIAGIVPGVLSVLVYMGVVAFLARRQPETMPRGPKFPIREQVKGTVKASPIILVIGAVIGGIYFGVYTPTEAGAVGVLGVGVLGAVIGGLGFRGLFSAAKEAAETTGMIFLIIVGAFVFGRFLSINQIPQTVVATVGDMAIGRFWILGILLVVYIIMGTFMDQLAVQVLTLPIVFPLILALGFDPYWFAIIFVKTVEIGLITPPLGLNVYVVSSVARVPVEDAFAGVRPFFFADLVTLAVLVAFPQITLWLPGTFS